MKSFVLRFSISDLEVAGAKCKVQEFCKCFGQFPKQPGPRREGDFSESRIFVSVLEVFRCRHGKCENYTFSHSFYISDLEVAGAKCKVQEFRKCFGQFPTQPGPRREGDFSESRRFVSVLEVFRCRHGKCENYTFSHSFYISDLGVAWAKCKVQEFRKCFGQFPTQPGPRRGGATFQNPGDL